MDLLYKTYRLAVEEIYRLTFNEDPVQLEYVDILAALNSIKSIGRLEREALVVAQQIRNRWAHEQELNFSDIAYATSILRAWLSFLVPKGPLGDADVFPVIVLLDVWLLNSGERFQIREEFPQPIAPKKQEVVSTSEPKYLPETQLISEIPDEAQFVKKGTIREFKDAPEWKEKLKGRRIIVLDGIHQGRFGTFKSWSGTVAYVNFDYLPGETISLSNKREIGVLRK